MKFNDNRTKRLRLAAKTLIEWKTPQTSPDYQRILKDLLETHPLAKKFEIDATHPLIKLDHKAIVLWFLSETMGKIESENFTDKYVVDYEDYAIKLIQKEIHAFESDPVRQITIYKMCYKGNRNKKINRFKVKNWMDMLKYLTITHDSSTGNTSKKAYLSILIPLNQQTIKDNISPIIGKLKFQDIADRTQNRIKSFFYNTTIALTATITIISFSIVIYDRIYLDKMPVSDLSMTPFTLSLIFFLATIFLKISKDIIEDIFDGTFYLIKSLYFKIGSKEVSVSKIIKQDFLPFTRHTFKSDPRHFLPVMKSNSDSWRNIFFHDPEFPNKEVTNTALVNLRNHELKLTTRIRIFHWLSKIANYDR